MGGLPTRGQGHRMMDKTRSGRRTHAEGAALLSVVAAPVPVSFDDQLYSSSRQSASSPTKRERWHLSTVPFGAGICRLLLERPTWERAIGIPFGCFVTCRASMTTVFVSIGLFHHDLLRADAKNQVILPNRLLQNRLHLYCLSPPSLCNV